MFVCMDQISGLNGTSKNFYFTIPTYRVAICMSNTQTLCNRLESHIEHFIEVPDCTISYCPYTS